MNKNTMNKLNFFAQGLKGRYEESKDFFIGMDLEFKSGKRFSKPTIRKNSTIIRNTWTWTLLKPWILLARRQASMRP